MRLNRRMRALLGGASLTDLSAIPLPPGLREVLADGWVTESSGALVLRRLREGTGLDPAGYPDLTGYEAAVNVVRIFDEDVAPDGNGTEADTESGPEAAVHVGLSFATAALRRLRDDATVRAVVGDAVGNAVGDGTASGGALAVVASGDETTPVTVRFYVDRPGELWLDDDLERYEQEGIAVLGVDDLAAD